MKIRRLRATLDLGSISQGTARPEDLIPTFLSNLDSQRPRQLPRKKFISNLRRRMRRRDYYGSEDLGTDLEGLFTAKDATEGFARYGRLSEPSQPQQKRGAI